MKIWKAQMRDLDVLSEFCAETGVRLGTELPLVSVQTELAQPEESLVGIYLVAAEEVPLIGVWVKPLRKTVAIHRVLTTLTEDSEDFQHYLKQFLSMLTYRFRASGKRSLFFYTGSDFVMKVALEEGFEPYNELKVYWKRDQVLPPVESQLPVQIRSFQAEDLDSLVEIEQSIFMPEVWNDRDTFREMAVEPEGKLFVATIFSQVVGYCYVCISDKGRAQVIRLGVHEDYQRFGIGKQLLVAGLEWLWAKGIREVMLQVRLENLPGRLLYERLGFVEESLEYLLLYSEGGV